MKIKKVLDNLIIYVSKYMIKGFDNKEKLEDYIKKLIIKLKKRGHNISGFYKVLVYCNDNYGIVIDMKKEEDLEFFPELIDLKIDIFYDSLMYFKFKDYFAINSKKIYFYNNNFYLNISDSKDIKILDNSEIIYGKEANNLKHKLIKV